MGKTFRNGKAIANAVMTVEPSIEGKCRIRRIDYDGTILGEEYVDVGSPMPTYPAPTPNDSRITFNKWVTQTDSATVQHDLDFGAIYDCNVEKTIGSTTVHPTILDCNFNSYTGLSPTIPISITSGHPVYIDWGDGSSVDTISSTGTKQHTYTEAGNYSIMIYSDANWYFNTSTSRDLLGSTAYDNALLKCIIGENFKQIRNYTFRNCYSLQYVILNDSVTSIADFSFTSCYSLQFVVFPDGVTSIGSNPFGDCRSLHSVIIPYSVTSIGGSIFKNCYSLQSVIIPDNITSIGANTFSGCHSLQSVIIPDSITNIGGNAFENCFSLQSAIIPYNVTSIGGGAFGYCHSLQSVIIPNNVTSIGLNALRGCYLLTILQIPLNWSMNIDFTLACHSLSDETFVSIANRIADLTSSTTQTWSNVPASRVYSIFVDENGERVPEGTAGAITLAEFITNKNWTLSFS